MSGRIRPFGRSGSRVRNPAGGFPPSGFDPLRDAAGQRVSLHTPPYVLPMHIGGNNNGITSLPDPGGMDGFDYPLHSFMRWKAVLAATTFLNDDLMTFFVGYADARRFVLMFRKINKFKPRYGGHDMREAEIGSMYDLDVLVSLTKVVPMVERAERIIAFA